MIQNLKTFNSDFEEKIKNFSALVKDFKNLEMRLDKISAQKKRKFEIRDTGFEKDFCIFALALQKSSITIYDFIQELRFNSLRIFPKEDTLILKEFAISCIACNTQIKNFDIIFNTVGGQVQETSLNLKWGLVSTARNDLVTLGKQLLSLVKEVKKYYE